MADSISLCMIVKDEEAVLARCLDSVRALVDEVIIIDTGSTDRTAQIAAAYTDKVYNFDWCDDFAAARNFSFEKASGDYILWLDADDIVLPDDLRQLLRIKKKGIGADVLMVRYNTGFDKLGRPTLSFYRERILRRSMGFHWVGRVHEVIQPRGKVLYTQAAITHHKLHRNDPGRNLRIFETMRREGQPFDPRQQFYYGRELYYAGAYDRAKKELQAFLQRPEGWVENQVEACRTLSQCCRALDDPSGALQALFSSFLYDQPRAEVCCDIGHLFINRRQYRQAAYWYQQAAARPRIEGGGFYSPACYDFIPYLQLCLCCDRLGDYQKAWDYNEKAAALRPDEPAIAHNRQYLGELLGRKQTKKRAKTAR